MKPAPSLGRQLVLAMVSTSLAGVAMSVAGLYLFCAILLRLAPQFLSTANSWLPSSVEWLAVAGAGAVGSAIATRAAVRLTQRILAPLDSVATSIRQIANGELSVRAVAEEKSLGEAAALVDDFNRMAANLEKASEGVAHWNAMIAHELRTPVTILRGLLQGLADGVFEPDPAMFRSLQLQAEGLARLVDDLRTVSLVESGHLDLMCTKVDLAQEIEGVVDLMRPGLEAAGFALSVGLEPGCVCADPTRIRQALMALLDNAERHASPGALGIRLQLNESGAEIEVTDQGPGLRPDFAEEVFTPFRRCCASSSNGAQAGSGLGLAVVRAIAKAHGGNATYEHRNGGACFRIYLPRTGPATQQPS